MIVFTIMIPTMVLIDNNKWKGKNSSIYQSKTLDGFTPDEIDSERENDNILTFLSSIFELHLVYFMRRSINLFLRAPFYS